MRIVRVAAFFGIGLCLLLATWAGYAASQAGTEPQGLGKLQHLKFYEEFEPFGTWYERIIPVKKKFYEEKTGKMVEVIDYYERPLSVSLPGHLKTVTEYRDNLDDLYQQFLNDEMTYEQFKEKAMMLRRNSVAVALGYKGGFLKFIGEDKPFGFWFFEQLDEAITYHEEKTGKRVDVVYDYKGSFSLGMMEGVYQEKVRKINQSLQEGKIDFEQFLAQYLEVRPSLVSNDS